MARYEITLSVNGEIRASVRAETAAALVTISGFLADLKPGELASVYVHRLGESR